MIYGNLISYSSTKKGKVWLFGRVPWVNSGARSSTDCPLFYIEGNYSNIFSNLSATGNEYQPLIMSPGDLIYAEFTITGGETVSRSTLLANGGWTRIGGAWAYTSAYRMWWRYYGSTIYTWSSRYVANGRDHHGSIEQNTSNIDKYYTIVGWFKSGVQTVGLESQTWPKTLNGYSVYYAATTTPPADSSSVTLRKFVWQPSDAVVPSYIPQYVSTTWSTYPTATRPNLYVEPIIAPGRSLYGNPSITLEEYESLHWNQDIITGP